MSGSVIYIPNVSQPCALGDVYSYFVCHMLYKPPESGLMLEV